MKIGNNQSSELMKVVNTKLKSRIDINGMVFRSVIIIIESGVEIIKKDNLNFQIGGETYKLIPHSFEGKKLVKI